MFCSISERFEKPVVLHAIHILKNRDENSPLILAISGPTGVGKTFQCTEVLTRIGVNPIVLTAGQFENQKAGEPARLFREQYSKALENNIQCFENHDREPQAIVLDDADVALGNWGDNYKYTMNTQNVIGEIMGIATSRNENAHGMRVPLYFTGNNLQTLYEPLRRVGRMDFFAWAPTNEELKDMVVHVFSGVLDVKDSEKLVDDMNKASEKLEVSAPSIAFYSTLRSHILDEYEWNTYLEIKQKYPLKFMRYNLKPVEIKSIRYEEICNAGYEMLSEISNGLKNQLTVYA